MSFTSWGIVLMAIYIGLTLFSPLALSHPRFLVTNPLLCLRLWLVTFFTAAVSLTLALGIFIALALRHHVTHEAGHDALGPLIDQFLGWLSIAVVGVLAFRMGVAVQDARAAVASLTGEIAPLLATASQKWIGNHEVWVVESSVILMGARSGRVLATSAVIELLSPEQLAAVVEHERTHITQHHARLIAVANLAEAIAPSLKAGSGFGSAARITTELIADDAAARKFGNLETAAALELAYPFAPGMSERVTRLKLRG